MSNQPLTGRHRYRVGLFGRVILQVEYAFIEPHTSLDNRSTDWRLTGRAWRDATVEDITASKTQPDAT